MIEHRKLILCGAVALALGACSRDGVDNGPTQTPPLAEVPVRQSGVPALPVGPPPDANLPATASRAGVTVGNSLQGEAVVASQSAQFSIADTVYVGASVKGKKPGSEVAVYWTYEDGRTHREERRKLAGEQYVSFSFSKADGMKPGKYNAQIDVDRVPIGLADFLVK